MSPKLIGLNELAEILGIPPSWIYSRSRTDSIPMIRVGKYIKFDLDEVMAWLKKKNEDA